MSITHTVPDSAHIVQAQPGSAMRGNASRLNWAAVLLLVLTSGLLIWILRNYTETLRLIDKTHDVTLLIQQLLSTVADAETGQRGFVITGDEVYVKPYKEAAARIGNEIDIVRGLTTANPRQQQLLDRFSSLSSQKFAEMSETIALRRNRGEDAARALVVKGSGLNIMDQLRALTSDLTAESETLIAARVKQGRANVIRVFVLGCGSILLCVLCSLISVSLAKRILFESEERFRLMADFIAPQAWMADNTGSLFWYNQRWYDYTGRNSDQMGWGWQTVIDPQVLPVVVKRWTDSVASGEPFNMEFPVLGADGRFRVFQSRGMPWRDKTGEIVRWFGTNTDIHDLKEIQNELRLANEKLEVGIGERTADLLSANKALESFAYSVSHDLRAPLRHLDGFAGLLHNSSYEKLDAQGKRYLDKITASAQRMGQLIDDLLAFSRLQRTDVARSSVNLNLLQEEVRRELEPDMSGRTIAWTIGDLPNVYGDHSLLRQALTNLLSNAVKYTRDKPKALIEIGCENSAEGNATIFVRDNGAGFEMQYVHKLFEVFQRLHSDEYEGTGVGLAIVRRIVERHGGRVWAEGAVDLGATFYCSLPLNKE